MRELVTSIGLLLLMAAVAVAAPKPSGSTQPEQPFPATLRNARYVYVAAYDGDQFDPNLLPEDRDAIVAVENAIQKWGKLILVYQPDQADIVLLVQSRSSEDVLAVYDAHSMHGQYLWRVMGRDGLQRGETPLLTKFEKAFEGVQVNRAKVNQAK
jgi:hypothetical protein